MPDTHTPIGLAALEARLREDLEWLGLPVQPWVKPHAHQGQALLDVAMAHAARSLRLDAQGQSPGAVTIEMKTSFTRPGIGRIRAVGSVLHSTATLVFCEGKVFDEHDRLCAHATGTFKYLRDIPKSRPAAGSADEPHLQGPGSD